MVTEPGMAAPLSGEALRRKRLELGAFLRHRRSLLTPQEIGIAHVGRRHVRGLRREEVAAAAAIGLSWYTMLEQGRVERVSARTLDAIADALRLTTHERIHVRALAAGSFDQPAADRAAPSSALLRFVRDYPLGGAFLHAPTFDVVAWNAWSDGFFGWSAAGPHVNLLEAMVRVPAMRARFVDPGWYATLRRMVGHFRLSYAASGDERHHRLVETLSAESVEFAKIWRERPVIEAPNETHRIIHPALGSMTVEVMAFRSPAAPTYTMILNNPA